MSRSPLEYLRHILDEKTYLQSQVHELEEAISSDGSTRDNS